MRSILPLVSAISICLSALFTAIPAAPVQGSTTAADLIVNGYMSLARVRVGDAVTFQVNVNNIGSDPATNVVVTSTVPQNAVFNAALSSSSPAWSCPDGSPAGTVCTLTITDPLPIAGLIYAPLALTATLPAVPSNTYITATVTATSSTSDSTPDNNTSSASAIIDLRSIEAHKNAVLALDANNNGVGDSGDEITYTIDVTNTGPVAIDNFTLDDPVLVDSYPPPQVYADPLSNTISTTHGTVTPPFPTYYGWNMFRVIVPSFAAAAKMRVTYRARIRSDYPGTATETINRASLYENLGVFGGDLLGYTELVTTPLTLLPDLAVTKSGGQTPNGPSVFELNYANTGRAGADGITITETVPAGATFYAPASSPGWQCAGSICTYAAGSLAGYSPNDMFTPGGTATFAVTSTTNTPASMTSITNVVQIGHTGPLRDGVPGNNIYTATAAFGARPTYTVTLTAAFIIDQRNDGKAQTGDIIEYTARMTNTSNRNGAGVQLGVSSGDMYSPSPLQVLPDTISVSQGSFSQNGPAVQAWLGSLLPGASAWVRFRATVMTTPDRALGVINSSTSPADQYGYNEAYASVRTPAYYSENAAVTKQAQVARPDGLVDSGGVITYTILVTSTGDEALSGFYLRDGGTQIGPSYDHSCIMIHPPTISEGLGTVTYHNDSLATGFEVALNALAPGISGSAVFTATVMCPLGEAYNRAGIYEYDPFSPYNRKAIQASNETRVTIRGPRTGVFGQSLVTQHAQPAVARGETITLTTVITNAGTEALSNVTFYNSNYSCFTIVPGSATSSQGSASLLGDPLAVSANLGNLPVGATASIRFRATVSTLGSCMDISNMGVFQDGSGSLGNSPTLTRPVVAAHPPTTRYAYLPLVRR